MTHLRRLAARARAMVAPADVLAVAGLACLAYGVWLAWAPGGFILTGLALIGAARAGTEAR